MVRFGVENLLQTLFGGGDVAVVLVEHGQVQKCVDVWSFTGHNLFVDVDRLVLLTCQIQQVGELKEHFRMALVFPPGDTPQLRFDRLRSPCSWRSG